MEPPFEQIAVRRLANQRAEYACKVERTHIHAGGQGRERMLQIALAVEKLPRDLDTIHVPGKLLPRVLARVGGVLLFETSAQNLARKRFDGCRLRVAGEQSRKPELQVREAIRRRSNKVEGLSFRQRSNR